LRTAASKRARPRISAAGWLARSAEEARIHALEMADPIARETMGKIAEEYEKLAKRAEAREAAERKPPRR
jgi:hypothetical protein